MDFDTVAVVNEASLFRSKEDREYILAACRSESVMVSKESLHGQQGFLLPLSRDDSVFVAMTRRVYDSGCPQQFLEVLRSARRGGASFAMIMVPV